MGNNINEVEPQQAKNNNYVQNNNESIIGSAPPEQLPQQSMQVDIDTDSFLGRVVDMPDGTIARLSRSPEYGDPILRG
jgi:hypothetical protein